MSLKSMHHFLWAKKILILVFISVTYIIYLHQKTIHLSIRAAVKVEVALKECTWNASGSDGSVPVNTTSPDSFEEIEDLLSFVQVGGQWKPDHCQAKQTVAVVIPYKNRAENLKIFLRHFHPLLRSQLLKYRIFIIEQDDESPFNRAKLMNVGFVECLKYETYSNIVFHDVDLIAENEHNYYVCPDKPRHLCPAVDKFSYQLFSDKLFGGAVCFPRETFLQLNGFSNKYWGWGSEDDDLYWRMYHAKVKFSRPAMKIGRYTMLGHKQQERNGKAFNRLIKQETGQLNASHDGLNTLVYFTKRRRDYKLYTLIKVDLLMTQIEKNSTTVKKKSL